MPSPFYEQQVRSFAEQLRRNPDSFSYKGTTYECLANPVLNGRAMGRNNYEQIIPMVFHMWDDDFAATDLENGKTVVHENINYEIFRVDTSVNEPSVLLNCNRKQ